MDTSFSAQFSQIREAWEQTAEALRSPAWLAIVGKRLDELTPEEFYAGTAGLPDHAWAMLDQDGRIYTAWLNDGLQRPDGLLDNTVIVSGSSNDPLECCEWDNFSGGVPCAAIDRRYAIELGWLD